MNLIVLFVVDKFDFCTAKLFCITARLYQLGYLSDLFIHRKSIQPSHGEKNNSIKCHSIFYASP